MQLEWMKDESKERKKKTRTRHGWMLMGSHTGTTNLKKVLAVGKWHFQVGSLIRLESFAQVLVAGRIAVEAGPGRSQRVSGMRRSVAVEHVNCGAVEKDSKMRI